MSVRLLVNGKPYQAPPAATVARLLQDLKIPPARVAVEHNGRVLKRAEFQDTVLQDGDRVEIVQLVGGG